MSMKELAEQQNLKRKKVMSHYGVLEQYNRLNEQADSKLKTDSNDQIAFYLTSYTEGMEDFADAIIKHSHDWD